MADERSESETNKQIHGGSREQGTYVPGEVLRAVVVAGLAAHGDELVVDAGLLQGQQSPRHERRDSPPVHLHRRRSHGFLSALLSRVLRLALALLP